MRPMAKIPALARITACASLPHEGRLGREANGGVEAAAMAAHKPLPTPPKTLASRPSRPVVMPWCDGGRPCESREEYALESSKFHPAPPESFYCFKSICKGLVLSHFMSIAIPWFPPPATIFRGMKCGWLKTGVTVPVQRFGGSRP